MWAARLAFLGLKMLLKAGLQKQGLPDELLPAWMPVERSRLRQTVKLVLEKEADSPPTRRECRDLRSICMRARRLR